MKKTTKKEVRSEVKEALNHVVSSLQISDPSKKLKKLLASQTKLFTSQIIDDLRKKYDKEEKQLEVINRAQVRKKLKKT